MALVLTGVLGRGFVLCIDGGSVRVEASGLDGSCYSEHGDAPDHTAITSTFPRSAGYEHRAGLSFDGREPCNGCKDVTFLEGAAQLPAGSVAYVLPTPPVLLDFVGLRDDWSRESAVCLLRLHPSPPDQRSSDVNAVRKTVVLLI